MGKEIASRTGQSEGSSWDMGWSERRTPDTVIQTSILDLLPPDPSLTERLADL